MKKARLFTVTVHLFVVISALLVWSCSDEEDNNDHGVIKILVTDSPFSIDMIDEANVTISKIEIRNKDSVGGNPYIVVFEDSISLNLIDLRNGLVEELSNAEVPAGNYDLVRIYIDDANVKLLTGEVYDLKIPSGAQSGLKVFVQPGINVKGGLTHELLLDFELNKSFVAKGDPKYLDDVKGFNFKPVIRAVNNSFAGRIEGYILDDADNGIPAVNVYLKADTIVSSTLSDSTGFFALIGIPEGSYQLVSEKEGFETLTMEDVNITSSNKTEIDLQLTKSQE